jgi:hypothetical protein
VNGAGLIGGRNDTIRRGVGATGWGVDMARCGVDMGRWGVDMTCAWKHAESACFRPESASCHVGGARGRHHA